MEPVIIKCKKLYIPLLDVLQRSELVATCGEARRMVLQGAIKINDRVFHSVTTDLESGHIYNVEVGKRRKRTVIIIDARGDDE